MRTLFVRPLVAVASRWRMSRTASPKANSGVRSTEDAQMSVRARDAERALHAAADHADLKRIVEAQVRVAADRWWPGGPR